MAKLPFAQCDQCPLQQQPLVKPQVVDNAQLVVVGEAPGRTEVVQGKPFVGPSGKLLRLMLKEGGFDETKVHITNAVACWPAGNSTPTDKAIACCRPRLVAEIRQAKASAIVTAGATAAQAVGVPINGIVKDRGTKWYSDELEAWVTATLHPAYILRPFGHGDMPDMAYDVAHALQPANTAPTQWSLLPVPTISQHAQATGYLAYDIETSGLDWQHCQLRCISFSWAIGQAAIVDIETCTPQQLDTLVKQLNALFALPGVVFVGHNVKFDNKVLRRHGIKTPLAHDTLLMHYTIDERPGTQGLKYLAQKYLFVPPWVEDLLQYVPKKSRKTSDAYALVPTDVLWPYAARDTDYTLQLYHLFKDMITPAYDNIVLPAGRLVEKLEEGLLLLDMPLLHDTIVDYEKKQAALLTQLRDATKRADFNPNSTDHVAKFLFGTLGLPVTAVTPGGKPSTNKDVLLDIERQYSNVKEVSLLLDYKKLTKVLGTYLYTFEADADPQGYISSSLNVAGTVTGRLSGGIWLVFMRPDTNKYASVLRRLIIAPPGWLVCAADYSQAELRVVTCEAQEPVYRDMFIAGSDPHAGTADVLYGTQWRQQPDAKEYRVHAKTINFGILYGMGETKLATSTGLDLYEARQMLNTYWQRFKMLKHWFDVVHRQLLTDQEVVSKLGRVRRFDFIPDKKAQAEMLREGPNHIIQSTANDFNLLAANKLLAMTDIRVKHLMHDSIISWVRADNAQQLATIITQTMSDVAEQVYSGYVPFVADSGIGTSWGDAEKK